MATMLIRIDGDAAEEVDSVNSGSYLPNVDIGRRDYYLAKDSEEAGEASAKYWRDMASGDPKEFACIIGEKRLVQWALGQSDEYGISSLDDFCEVSSNHPEEQWASHDGSESDAMVNIPLAEELGWDTDGATLDTATLSTLIDDGEFDDIIPEPEDDEDERTAEDKAAWLQGRSQMEPEINERLDIARFVPCVAYRHN